MKWKIQSNPIILWVWMSGLVIVPLILFYLLFGEPNLLNLNWIIATNQQTPVFVYPENPNFFELTWTNWVNNLPSQYHSYFTALGQEATTTANYQPGAQATFFYPFTTVDANAIFIFLAFLFVNVSVLLIYHIVCRLFLKRPVLSTDSYAFLIAFWLVFLLLYYTGAFPGFAGGSNYAWYVIIIRVIILLLGIMVSFYVPFQINLRWHKKHNQIVYLEGLKQFKTDADYLEKSKVILPKSKAVTSIKLGK